MVRGNEGKHESKRQDHEENVGASSDQSGCCVEMPSNATTPEALGNSDLQQ